MYDVIVVGAGPAGATAARVCAESGLNTILIEKETIPRDKPCGGGISNAAREELGRDLPPELIECECNGMWAIQHKILTTVKRDHTVATMISRRNFDAWLVQLASEAGAEICQDEPCRTVQREKDAVLVTTKKRELRAQLVIGCDGVWSRVARLVRPPWTRKELRFCLITDVSRASPAGSPGTEDLVELRYGYVQQGYAWRFPKKDHISFGIGGSRKQSATLADSLASYLRLHGIEKSPSFQGCFIPITRFQGDVVSHRIMLCGDAAGFVDAFSGEGIRYALASGKLAGQRAVQSCRKQDFSRSFLMGYQKTFLKTYKTDLIWSARLSRLSSLFPRLILGPLLADSKTIRQYFRVMDGELRFIRFVWGVLLRMPWLMIRSLCPRKK